MSSTAVTTFTTSQAVFLGISGVLATLAAISPTQAAVIKQFTNRADFIAASDSLTNIDFEGLAPAGDYKNYGSTGLTQSGVKFTGSDSYLYAVDPAYSPSLYDWGSGAVLLGNNGGAITATLPTGITAIGSDISSFNYTSPTVWGYASDFLVSFSTGETFSLKLSDYPNRTFAGFIFDNPITSIAFKGVNGGYPEIDNFTFGKAKTPSVPEPLTILGTLTAAGFGVILRRKQKQQQKATAKV
ncbi:PEP-CTERM sorting domain-containing protein [Calothrix sp. NIES-2098]|uniref:PEP-CTERM sorting domain-containing protein n=1 Tax=Calothrix sp. NIES-2098 TaxID=1954171 RepID=UPI000BBBE07E